MKFLSGIALRRFLPIGRRHLFLRTVSPLSALFLLLASCTQHIYIVRHAEKAVVPAGADRMMASDPPLSAEGELRAAALAQVLHNESVSALYSTNYKRTKATLQPLASLKGLEIQTYSPVRDSAEVLIEKIRKVKRGTIVIAGHSNTVDDIVNHIMGKSVIPGDLPETEYDNLYIIRRKGKKYSFEASTYGVSTN